MRKIAYLLIVLGLILLAYPTMNHWVEDYQQNQLLRAWEIASAQDYPANSEPESIGRELNRLFEETAGSGEDASKEAPSLGQRTLEQAAMPVAETATAEPSSNPQKPAAPVPVKKAPPVAQPKVIGVIKIEAISLKLPFVEGVSAQDIKAAPGHLPGTALPGQVGNAVIAGHRSYSYGRMFNRLEELEPGHSITIETAGHAYDYIIYDKKMVDPDDVSVLNRNDKDKVLTLITCDEEGKRRLILHAKMK